jgi:hypothetical protein
MQQQETEEVSHFSKNISAKYQSVLKDVLTITLAIGTYLSESPGAYCPFGTAHIAPPPQKRPNLDSATVFTS